MATITGTNNRDNYNGTSGSDTIYGLGGNDKLDGGAGNDLIDGGADNDEIDGGSGDDTLIGGLGRDTIGGGTGNDQIDGGDGDDRLDGDDGNDTITGGIGKDVMEGGNGNDRLDGGSDDDSIDGDNGLDTIYGGAGNDLIAGGNDSDWISGDDGNDIIDGDDGNDTIFGGAGSDALFGGNNDDLIDGGSGTDLLFGEAGNDRLVFRMADHGPATSGLLRLLSLNIYDGGLGNDTLRLAFTRDEWLRADVQADMAGYRAFLTAEPGRLYDLPGNEFHGIFTFNAFDLAVTRLENLEITVDGVTVDPLDRAVTLIADRIAVTEEAANVAFNVLANDSAPNMVRGVSYSQAAHGVVTMPASSFVSATAPQANLVYTPNATYYQYLSAGQTATDSFSYTVTDVDGDTATATVTVTITGVNDGPLIVSGATTASLIEDAAATLTSSGTIVFGDVDLTDTHTVAVGPARTTISGNAPATFAPAGGFGTMTAVVNEVTTDQNPQGNLVWTFQANNAQVQGLAAGQTATQVYTLTLTDRAGATVTRDVTVTLTGGNDAPTIAAQVLAGAVVEDAAVTATGTFAFADVDIVNSHAVAVAARGTGYLGTLNATVADAATGDGAGTIRWDFAVDNSQIQNLAAGEKLTQSYNVTVTDNIGASAVQVVTVTITGTNDGPVAVSDVASATEDAAIVTGSVAGNDSDVDHGAALSYALNAPVAGLTINPNGTYSFNPADAVYQNLAAGQTRAVVANYTVTDDKGATATATLTITVTGTNDGPVAVADVKAATEDATAAGSVATNDSDVDTGAVLSYALTAPVAGLTLNTNGGYSFDASNAAYQNLADGQSRAVVATYSVTDDKGATATSTLTITVTGTNDGPVAAADTRAASEDTVVNGSVATNDSDVDAGATLGYALNSPVAGLTLGGNGAYSFDAGNAAYQNLAAGQTRNVVANYTVTDDKGATAVSTLTITVTGTNDAPVARVDTALATEDAPAVTGSVATNDSDVDAGATLGYALNSPVAGLTLGGNGAYSFDAGNAAYQNLAAGQTRDVVASYTVTDDKGATAASTLTITVTGTNDGPVAVADVAAATEDAAAITGSVATNDSDVDAGATLSYALNSPVAGLTINGAGGYSFNPTDAVYQDLAAGQSRAVVANYTVTDDKGVAATSTLTITVTGTNDTPVAVVDTKAANEDATVTGSVATNDSDVDAGAVLGYALDTPVAGLTLATNGGYTFDAANAAYQNLAAGQTRELVAGYTVTDDKGATATSTLTITVTGTNDGPVANTDTFGTTEDTAFSFDVRTNDTDIDNGAVLTVTQINGVAITPGGSVATTGGLISMRADGSLGYTPAANANGVFSFNYTIVDDKGAVSSAVATINIAAVNDAPVVSGAVRGTAVEDGTPVTLDALANATDIDAGATLSVVDLPTNLPAGVTYDAATHLFTFHPDHPAYQMLAQGQAANVTIGYGVSDGIAVSAATAVWALTGANDRPYAGNDLAGATEDGGAITGAVVTNDGDIDTGAVLTYRLNAPVAGLTLGGSGSYSFDPGNSAYQYLGQGQQVFVLGDYTVTDEHGATATATLRITVTGTNDVPMAVADAVALAEDVTLNGSVATNDGDVDAGAILTYTLDGAVPGLTLDTNGSYTFDAGVAAYQNLAAGEVRVVTANYTVTDNFHATATSTLTIAVTGTNDAPIAIADVASATEDSSAVTGSVAANDSDVDNGATLGFALNAPVAGLTLATNGSYSFDPANAAYQNLAAGEVRAIAANYTVTDDRGATATSTLTITVTGTNDGPVAVADTRAATEDTIVTGSVATNDSDVDTGAVLTYALDAPIVGLTLATNGGYSFDASNADYQNLAFGQTRDVVAGYTVTDDKGATASSTLTITVTGTNDGPVAGADTALAVEDATTVAGSVAANDSDVDSGTVLTYALNAAVAGLTLGTDGAYSFNPADTAYQNLAAGEVRTIVANYTVTDDQGATAPSTLTVTVTGTNDAPVAIVDTVSATEDAAAITGSVATNDGDVDAGATLSYALDTPVAGLTLATNGGYIFDPTDATYQNLAQGQVRTVVAAYTVTDDKGATATSTLTITVTGTNDVPVAVADIRAAIEDTVVTGSVATNDSDVDAGATLAYTLNAPAAGLTLAADGSYSFDAGNAAYQNLADGESRVVVANYAVTDDRGATATSTLAITVTGTNDAPVAVADTRAATEDTIVTGSVATNDSDVDAGATLSYALDAAIAGLTLAADGSYSFDAANAAYQDLAAGQTRDVVASYTVTDDKGATATSTLTVTVTGANDGPVATADVAVATEDAATLTGSVAINDSDVDAGATLGYALNAAVAGLTLNNNGSYSFDAGNPAYQGLALGETRAVVADYTVTDDKGASASSTLTITVTGSNDVPIAAVDVTAATEDGTVVTGSVATNDSDIDAGATLSYALNAAVAGLTLATNGAYSFNPSNAAYQNLAVGEIRTVAANYTVTDDKGATATSTLTLNVTGANDGPIVTSGAAAAARTVVEAGNTDAGAIVAGTPSATGTLTASDADAGATRTWSGSAAGTYGAFAIAAGGVWTYTLDNASAATQAVAEGQTRTETFTAAVTDDQGATATQVVTVTVTGTNDSPVITSAVAAATGSVTEAGQLDDRSVVAGIPSATGTLSSSDVDTGATATWSATGTGAYGTFATTAAGAWTYTLDNTRAATQGLNEGQTVTETFTARVTDDKGAFVTTPVVVTVNGTNDAPVVQDVNVAGSSAVTVGFVIGSTVVLALADNNGDSRPEAASSTTPIGTAQYGIATGDIDGDGDADIVVANYSNITVYTNRGDVTGDGKIDFSSGYGISAPTGTYDVALGDINGDGKLDIVGGSGSTLIEVLNLGDTNANGIADNFVIRTITGTSGQTYGITVGDINGDGRADIVQSNYASGPTTIRYNLGDINADSQIDYRIQTLAGTNGLGVAIGDFNGDGRLDLFQSRWAEESEQIYLNRGDANNDGQLDFTIITLPTAGSTLESQLIDIDRDGDLDVVMPNQSAAAVIIAYNVGDTNSDGVVDFSLSTITGAAYSYSVAVGDIDGDGDYDILTGSGAPIYLSNQGDTNGDGKLDFIPVTLSGVTGGWDAEFLVQGTTSGGAREDGAPVTALFGGDDVDADDTQASLTYLILTQPGEGTVVNNNNGTFTFATGSAFQDLGAGQTRNVSFTYQATDVHGAVSAPATVRVTVGGTNDAPIVSGVVTGAATEDGAAVTLNALANASDVDTGAILSVINVGTLPAGVGYDAAARSFTLNPANAAYQSLAQGQTMTVTVGYQVSDGIVAVPTTASWTVTGTNDAPVATNLSAAQSYTEDTPLNLIDIVASDVDSATLTATLTLGNVAAGALTTATSGAATSTYNATTGVWTASGATANVNVLLAGVSFAPAANFNGSFTVATSVSDGSVAVTGSKSFSGTAVNDAPVVAVAIPDQSSPEDAAWSYVVAAGSFTDIDSASLSYSATLSTGAALPSWVTFNAATRTFSGTPPLNFNGALDLRVTASDGTLSANDTFTLNVTPVNDVPNLVKASDGFTLNAATGHSYRVVNGGTAVWESAVTLAQGMGGYLATATNAAENSFILSLGSGNHFIGANKLGDGIWNWATGPEAGIVIGGANFSSFDTNEGNSAGQDYLLSLNANGGGVWHDVENNNPGAVFGYVVERIGDWTIVEREDGSAGENSVTHTGTGTLNFTDVDLGDTHSATATPQAAGYFGTFAVTVDQALDKVTWSFSVADSTIDELAYGQELRQSYDITVSDGNGGFDTETITIVVAGSTDGPISGNASANTLTGTNIENFISGLGGNDALSGLDGNDVLNGGTGTDTLAGGSGNDVFLFRPGEANGDVVTDFNGNGAALGDILRFEGFGTGAVFAMTNSIQGTITYNGGTMEVITFANAPVILTSDYLFV